MSFGFLPEFMLINKSACPNLQPIGIPLKMNYNKDYGDP